MRELKIAIGLIRQGEAYLLQHRLGDPKIGAAGLIGAFGGKIEEGEEPLTTICREINEETSLSSTHKDFKKVGEVVVVSDHKLEPVKVIAKVFEIHMKPEVKLTTEEGQIIKLTKDEAIKMQSKLTPATRAAFQELIKWL